MVEVVVDQKPMPQAPYDPSLIPESVKRRAAAVDALYTKEGFVPTPAPAAETPEQLPLPMDAPAVPPPAAVAPPPPADEDTAEGWKQRFVRMQGRYNASQKTIGEMQEQMTQLGNELVHAQNRASQTNHRPTPPPTQNYLTEKDVAEYGTDLVDFTQRAAAQAIAPQLQAIEAQNQELRERLAREARRGLDQRVETAVPNYREIDRNPRWHSWLLGIDVLSGRVRQTLLNEAIASAEAPRVISFFRGFLQEEAATGHIEPASYSHQAAPPREPAIPLASLAAPGRARPATGGDTGMPPERPIYSRAQIKQLYEMHRKGAYIGREAEWARQDADIIAASREGRIQ